VISLLKVSALKRDMKNFPLPVLSLLTGVAVSTSCFAFEAPALTDMEVTDLQNGEAIISVWKDREREHKPTISRGGIDIMVPAAEILTIMKDCALMAKVSSDIRGCEVLEESEDGSWDIRKQKFAVSPVLPKFKTTFRTHYTADPVKGYVMEIEKISGDLNTAQSMKSLLLMVKTGLDLRILKTIPIRTLFGKHPNVAAAHKSQRAYPSRRIQISGCFMRIAVPFRAAFQKSLGYSKSLQQA